MRILALGLLFAATTAAADAPGAPASPPPGVWRETISGELENLQSGLRCPFRIGDYYRNAAVAFDPYGLDVGCDYRRRGSAVTFYLTRRSGAGLDAVLAQAQDEVVKFGAAKHPQSLGVSRLTADGLAWTTALYAEDGGLHSAIWLADLNGWTLQYRATYTVGQETQVRADLQQMTAFVRASAGARLALCAVAPPRVRPGAMLTDDAEIGSATLNTSLVGGAAMAAARDGDTRPEPAPVWCADKGLAQGGFHLMFWHAVDPTTGADRRVDRISVVDTTTRPAPVLQVARESLNDDPGADGRPSLWAATITKSDRVMIMGYFHGRPTAEAVASLYSDILTGRAKALGSYSASGKDITIDLPGGA